jgi:hypothetical protein
MLDVYNLCSIHLLYDFEASLLCVCVCVCVCVVKLTASLARQMLYGLTHTPQLLQDIKTRILARRQWLMPVILADQEDLGSKPAWANSLRNPIQKKKKHTTGLVE